MATSTSMKIGPPQPAAFRHFIELVRGLTGVIYGRRLYEIMRYWDDDLPDWDAEDREFASAWRNLPKSYRIPSSPLAPTPRLSRMTL